MARSGIAGALAAERVELGRAARAAASPGRSSASGPAASRSRSPGDRDPGQVALDVGGEHRDAGAPRSARPAPAASCVLPVPVAPATRPCRFSIDSGDPDPGVGDRGAVLHQHPEVDGGLFEGVAPPDLLDEAASGHGVSHESKLGTRVRQSRASIRIAKPCPAVTGSCSKRPTFPDHPPRLPEKLRRNLAVPRPVRQRGPGR